MQGLELVRRAKGTTASTFTCPGFVTNRMAALPTAFVSILGVVALLAGLALTVYGATLMLLGNQLGHKQGSLDGGWLKGGVGGVFFGAAAFGELDRLARASGNGGRDRELTPGKQVRLAQPSLCSVLFVKMNLPLVAPHTSLLSCAWLSAEPSQAADGTS